MRAYLAFAGSVAFGLASSAIHRAWVLAEYDTAHPPGANLGGTGNTFYNYSGTTKEPSAVRPALATALTAMPQSASPIDVCIIGGGYAGMHAALALAERGKKVVLLEANRIGSGASGRNGGDAVIGFHTSVDELAEWTRSKDKARELFSHTEMGYERLKAVIAKYRIQCDAKEHGAVTMSFASEARHAPDAAIKAAVDAVNDEYKGKLQFRDKKALEASGIVTERYRCGVFEPRVLQINPLELCFGLARACESTGNVVIHEQSKVLAVEHDDVRGTFTCTTASGSVTAKKCILATNHAPASISPALAMLTSPVSTSVILTAPLPKEKLDRCLSEKAPACFDDRFGLAYFRRVPGDRIMYGCFASGLPLRNGAAANGGLLGSLIGTKKQGGLAVNADREKAQAALVKDLVKTFPSLAEDVRVDRWWSGRLQAQFPIFPLMGREASTGMYYSLGYAGHGLVPTCAAGQLLANAICDGDTRYELWGQVVPWWLPAGGPHGYVATTIACALLRWYDTAKGRA